MTPSEEKVAAQETTKLCFSSTLHLTENHPEKDEKGLKIGQKLIKHNWVRISKIKAEETKKL